MYLLIEHHMGIWLSRSCCKSVVLANQVREFEHSTVFARLLGVS